MLICISEMTLSALILVGALNTANTVNTLEKMIKCDAALEIILDSEISHPMEKNGSILDFFLDKEEQEGHCYAKLVFLNNLAASRNNVSFYLPGPTQIGL